MVKLLKDQDLILYQDVILSLNYDILHLIIFIRKSKKYQNQKIIPEIFVNTFWTFFSVIGGQNIISVLNLYNFEIILEIIFEINKIIKLTLLDNILE